jgi:hypothetical protein
MDHAFGYRRRHVNEQRTRWRCRSAVDASQPMFLALPDWRELATDPAASVSEPGRKSVLTRTDLPMRGHSIPARVFGTDRYPHKCERVSLFVLLGGVGV